MTELTDLMEFLPFLIPLIVLQFAVLGWALFHIFTHTSYKRGTRALWVAISVIFMNTFIGPILYFLLGKEDS